ncbi:unnamed protein product [Peniophora sp. CBMAI 1063]|nr:unnamed protein product [Peniophora sp. CBMAI 1063]
MAAASSCAVDVLFMIFYYLDNRVDQFRAMHVCQSWRGIGQMFLGQSASDGLEVLRFVAPLRFSEDSKQYRLKEERRVFSPWPVVRGYAESVRNVTLDADDVHVEVAEFIQGIVPAQCRFLPKLQKLALRFRYSPGPEVLALSRILAHEGVRELRIYGVDPLVHKSDPKPFTAVLETLFALAPNIRTLKLGANASPTADQNDCLDITVSNVIPCLKQLEDMEMSPCFFAPRTLHELYNLRGLKSIRALTPRHVDWSCAGRAAAIKPASYYHDHFESYLPEHYGDALQGLTVISPIDKTNEHFGVRYDRFRNISSLHICVCGEELPTSGWSRSRFIPGVEAPKVEKLLVNVISTCPRLDDLRVSLESPQCDHIDDRGRHSSPLEFSHLLPLKNARRLRSLIIEGAEVNVSHQDLLSLVAPLSMLQCLVLDIRPHWSLEGDSQTEYEPPLGLLGDGDSDIIQQIATMCPQLTTFGCYFNFGSMRAPRSNRCITGAIHTLLFGNSPPPSWPKEVFDLWCGKNVDWSACASLTDWWGTIPPQGVPGAWKYCNRLETACLAAKMRPWERYMRPVLGIQ